MFALAGLQKLIMVSLTFLHFTLSTLQFLDISRFSRWVVTMTTPSLYHSSLKLHLFHESFPSDCRFCLHIAGLRPDLLCYADFSSFHPSVFHHSEECLSREVQNIPSSFHYDSNIKSHQSTSELSHHICDNLTDHSDRGWGDLDPQTSWSATFPPLLFRGPSWLPISF